MIKQKEQKVFTSYLENVKGKLSPYNVEVL